MRRVLVKILLLILRLILKLAKIFAFKKLESFLTEFLGRKFDFNIELKPTKKKATISGVGQKTTKITKDITKRETPSLKDELNKDFDTTTDITISRDTDTGGINATPILITAGIVVAGVSTVSAARAANKTKTTENVTEDSEKTDKYKKAFFKGLDEGLNKTTKDTIEQGGGTKKSFFERLFSVIDELGGESEDKPSQKVITTSEYQQYATVTRLGQSMNVLDKYTYNSGSQSIGISTQSGARMRKINEIIIHCTATHEGKEMSLKELHEQHVKRGFIGIGYHFVIHLDGTIESARPLYMMGAHCYGHNAHSIGITYVGGVTEKDKPKDTRTSAQRQQIWKLVLYLLRYFSSATIHGHYEYANKACPCFNVQKEWEEVQSGTLGSGNIEFLGSSTSETHMLSQFVDDTYKQEVDKNIIVVNETGF